MAASPIQNPPVPFVVNLEGGLTPKRTIIIKGFISQAASRFDINFAVGATGDIALQISGHIKEGSVVRNTFENGTWGKEERIIAFNPFQAGQFFDMTICASSEYFQVYAGGNHVFDYNYRTSALAMVNVLQITGDVHLSSVQV